LEQQQQQPQIKQQEVVVVVVDQQQILGDLQIRVKLVQKQIQILQINLLHQLDPNLYQKIKIIIFLLI
jgi:hypothetical protein